MKNLVLLIVLMASVFVKAQAPVASFSFTPSTPCGGTSVQVTDMSTNSPTAWSYTFSGGAPATSTLQNPIVTFAAQGIHTITLIASNGSGTSTPITQTITVLQGANFFAAPPSKTMCIGGGPLTFTATIGGPGPTLTYSWSNGPTTSVVAVSPASTTIYTCVATSTNGCFSQKTVTAVVKPLPTVTIAANPVGICGGGSSTLTAFESAPGPFTYTWSTAANSKTISTNLTGVYSVTVANGGGSGCIASKTYTLGSIAALTLNAISNPIAICAPNAATLFVMGASSYTWSNLATTATTAVTPTTNTTYTVFGMAGTCTAITTVLVLVDVTPTIIASANPSVLCNGYSVNLMASGANTYTWLPGPIIGGTVMASPTVPTTYTVRGKNACGLSTVSVMVNVNPSPTINVSSSSPVLCPGDSAMLTMTTTATSYTWDSGSNNNSISVSPTVTTTYTVIGTGGNGCVSSATISEIVSLCTGIQTFGISNSELNIYPNPNKGEFILITDHVNSELKIVDVVGKVVFTKTLPETESRIIASTLCEGIYYARVINGKNVVMKKIVIEK